jgi:hypothetical protein
LANYYLGINPGYADVIYAPCRLILQVGRKDDKGLSKYYQNIGGGALTFGFIAIALRRKFERKYTR